MAESKSINMQDQEDEIEAVQAIFETFHEGSCAISSFSSGSQHMLQMKLSPALDSEVTVEVGLPDSDPDSDPDGAGGSPVPSSSAARLNYSRSNSGHRYCTKITVRHLLPLGFNMTLPEGYPGDAEVPHFTLSCHWLSQVQLASVCKKLDQLWEEFKGMAIISVWAEWIRSSMLRFLCITDGVSLTLGSQDTADLDSRAQPFICSLEEFINQLLQYDSEQTTLHFRSSIHECGICCEELRGRQMFLIRECGHHFCEPCIKEMCYMHITEGTVLMLKCPGMECDVDLSHDTIKSCVNEEMFGRWQNLVLQKGLETMGDVMECSRCKNKVIIEKDGSQLGSCTVCFFNFCTKCGDSWHQNSECYADLKTRMDPDTLNELQAQEEENKEKLNQRYLRYIEHLNMMRIKADTKPCPVCQSGIYKDEGCNKVLCANCHSSMCWVCGKKISDYAHFQGGDCHLLNVPEVVLPDKIVKIEEKQRAVFEAQDRAAAENSAKNKKLPRLNWKYLCKKEQENSRKCPNCGQLHLKAGTNNHTKCWRCRVDFCFVCCIRISPPVTAHYRLPSTCKQHS